MKFGTRFAMPRRVTQLEKRASQDFCATLDEGVVVKARSVIVATGVQYRRLPLDRLEDFEGDGVYYAATESEARYCRDTEVVIIGGGNSAGQAAMFLCRVARKVHMLVRGDSLASSMSDYLRSRLDADPSVTIHYGAQLASLQGEESLASVTVQRRSDDETWEIPTRALFIMVGAAPNTGWLEGIAALDDKGFLLTGDAAGESSRFATSCDGVFAVGDVRAGSVKRVASAVGEGSVVISEVWQTLQA